MRASSGELRLFEYVVWGHTLPPLTEVDPIGGFRIQVDQKALEKKRSAIAAAAAGDSRCARSILHAIRPALTVSPSHDIFIPEINERIRERSVPELWTIRKTGPSQFSS